jgi:hypothetical protein
MSTKHSLRPFSKIFKSLQNKLKTGREKAAMLASTFGILSSIGSSLSKIFLSFLASIVNDMSILFGQIFGGFGQSIVLMFQSFGNSLGPYGPLAPTVFVGGLLLSVVVGYIEFDVIDAERDVTGFENDI